MVVGIAKWSNLAQGLIGSALIGSVLSQILCPRVELRLKNSTQFIIEPSLGLDQKDRANLWAQIFIRALLKILIKQNSKNTFNKSKYNTSYKVKS